MAPALEEMAAPKRKKGKLGMMWLRAKSLVGLGKELSEAAADLVDDSCDVDEPEVCADDGNVQAAKRDVRTLIAKTLRFARGAATKEELESEDASGDSMESGWQTRSQGSACALRRRTRCRRLVHASRLTRGGGGAAPRPG